jgi:ATPase subunit of ABC transporter with duplicated ATPase domains
MAEFIYTMVRARKAVGDKVILDDVTMSFFPGAKIGVVGPNGAGKSTILKIMAGLDTEFDGETRLADGYTVGYLRQEPQLDPEKTVFENVMEAVDHSRAVLRRFEEINTRLGEPIDDAEMEKLLAEQATVQDEIDVKNLWDLDRQVEIAMDAMNLPPADWAVTNLSGGERRRVALCKLLLEKPDLLLLDEPTNHLDAESVDWLERHLAEYTGTVVAVTHDRYFLDNVAKWILEVDHGRGIPFEGNYTSWLQQKKARLELEIFCCNIGDKPPILERLGRALKVRRDHRERHLVKDVVSQPPKGRPPRRIERAHVAAEFFRQPRAKRNL